MSRVLIQNVRVLEFDEPPSQPSQVVISPERDITIVGNRIEDVVPTGSIDPSHFDQVIAADHNLAMPGLINTHAHVPMVIFRGLAEDVDIDVWFNDYVWPLECNLTPDDVYYGMLLGLAEMLECGVTSVADHYWHMDRAARAVEEAGTRALLGQAMFADQGPTRLDECAAFATRWHGAAGGRIRTIMAPHAPYTCDDDFLSACAHRAESLALGIHIHAAETAAQSRDSVARRGQTPIEVLEHTGVLSVPTIIAHGNGATERDIEILARHQVGIAHCPKTYFKLAMDYAPVVEFRSAGIPVGLGTDGAMSNNTLDIFESMRLMAMGQKHRLKSARAMDLSAALHVATRESAQVFGLGDDLGAIRAGKLADIILIDLGGTHHQPLHNPAASLVYHLHPGDVHTVICDGEVVMRDRQLLTIDKRAIIDHLREHRARLANRPADRRIQTYRP